MTKNKYFNLNSKINLKNIIDIGFLTLILGIVLYTMFRNSFENELKISIIIVCFLLFILQYEASKRWIVRSLKINLKNEAELTESSANKALDLTLAQKNLAEEYKKLLVNAQQAIEQLKKSSIKAKYSAQTAAGKTQQSLNFSNKEQDSVKENIEKMFTLKQKIQIIAELILELSEHIQQISSTIGVVEDIAEQTNMLALNAAVEAARAGEHGKGFAVVAGEIRKLADESKQATTKISSLINDIQQATNSTVMATEEGTKEIESGVKLAHNIDENIQALISIISELNNSVEDLLASADCQTLLSNNVIEIISSLDSSLKDSMNNIDKNIENINVLSSASSNLKNNIINE